MTSTASNRSQKCWGSAFPPERAIDNCCNRKGGFSRFASD